MTEPPATVSRVLPWVTEVVGFALPLRESFRGLTVREGLLLRGPCGWGEWAPFENYDDVVAARWLAAATEWACTRVAVPQGQSVPVNLIVPGSPDADAVYRNTLEDLAATGADTVKIKVGGGVGVDDLERDIARVDAVRRALDEIGLSGLGRIRLDANGSWSVGQARERLPVLAAVAGELEYVEQPCASVAECAALREAVDVRIALDEGVRLGDVSRDESWFAHLRNAADLLVLKAIPLGGIARARELAQAVGLPAVVSGSLDSSVGLAQGLELAASLASVGSPQSPGTELAAGLGTGVLLLRDVVAEPIRPRDGRIQAGRVEPEADALRRVAMPPNREAFWLGRLERVAAYAAANPDAE